MTQEQEAQRLIEDHKKVIINRTDCFNAYSDISFAKESAAITAKRVVEFIYAMPIINETFSYRKEQLERWEKILNYIKESQASKEV